MDGDEGWMKLDKDGKQAYLGGKYTPAEVLNKLIGGKGVKQWQTDFTASIKPECGGLCVLECHKCKANLSASNPARVRARHKCKAAALEAAGASGPRKRPRDAGDAECEDVQPVKMTPMQKFTVSPAQHRQFHRYMCMHLISAEVPFKKMECPWIR